jgi:hypothetical protein
LLLGAVGGGAAGALLGMSSGGSSDGFFTSGDMAGIGAVVLGAVGTVVGTAVGASKEREVWAVARQPIGGVAGVSFNVAPLVGRRVGVAARLTF